MARLTGVAQQLSLNERERLRGQVRARRSRGGGVLDRAFPRASLAAGARVRIKDRPARRAAPRPVACPQVFQPYVPLPTISVEQQGVMELAEARAREARARESEAARAAAEAGRRSDDEDEDEVARARAWDDFKDDNPRGWGNSKLRPCA
jgi:hypothetical protein